MIKQCLNLSNNAIKAKHDSLKSKYNASDAALDHAIYSWANANEALIERDGGIDITNPSAEDYLDNYFKIKSSHYYDSKSDYNKAIKAYNTIKKTEFRDPEEANERYNKYVKYFGEENTVMYKTPEGTTIVRLAEPMQSPKLEMQDIKEKAIANGTFMKAPNGNPTNLNERQWLQVRTKAFKDWFGDWEKVANITEEELQAASLIFDRVPELAKIGTPTEYAAYIKEIFPNSVEKEVYWHGSNEDFSEGFASAKRGEGSGALETKKRNDLYLNKQGWASLQYVNGINRKGRDKNGFAHWNKLWWELKEIMSNGRRENNDWKDIVIDESTIRQAIPNKKGVFNRDSGGKNGKWLSERKADYGYENKSDKEFFEEIFGIKLGKDTFNTWTARNAEIFKSLEKSAKGINPVVIDVRNPITEEGQNTYYEEQRGLFTTADAEGNDAILSKKADNEFNSDVAIVINANNDNVYWLGTKSDIERFKQWKTNNDVSKVVDENGEPLVVYHSNNAKSFDSSRNTNWFSSKKQNYYGDNQYAVFLNIKNLFRRDSPSLEERAYITDYGTGNKYDKLPKEYDGGMVYHNVFGYYELLTTNPNQIKSVTDNTGEFSRSNDDINLYEDDFFNDDTPISQFPQVDSSLEKGKTYSIDKLEELFNAYNTDKEQRQLSEKIFKVAKRLGFKVSFLEELGFGKGGLQVGDVIKIARITTLERNKEKLPDVILHEVIHGVSSYVIDAYKNGELKDQNLIEAAQILSDAYNTLKNDESLVGEYGIKNEKEMLAEMANPKFREKLKAINLWTRIKEAIKKIFSINSSNLTADKALSTALDKILDNYDVNLFEDYSRTKDYNTKDFNFYEQKDPVTESYNKLMAVKEAFKSRIKVDKETHTYTVYSSAEDKKNDVNGQEAISVTQYIYGKKDIGAWGVPSDAIGNTNDTIIRDFFNKKFKKSYPNMSSTQLQNFAEDLETFEKYLKSVHGENCKIITEEFPIAAKYTIIENGKPIVKYMAGTMDMIVIDENGKYWGYDMKAKRSGIKASDKVNYGNQLGLYNSIFRPYDIEFEGNKIIHSATWYEDPIDADYSVDENGQLWDGNTKIQQVKSYQAPRLALSDNGRVGKNTVIPVSLDDGNEKMVLEFGSLSEEDKALIEEEIGIPRRRKAAKESSMTYEKSKRKSKSAAKSGLYNPLLSSEERKFLADNMMCQLSFIVTHLQTSTLANYGSENSYFPDGRYKGKDFTTMTRDQIFETINIRELFDIVKTRVLENAMNQAEDEDAYSKLEIAYDNFYDLINEGYAKLIALEKRTVVTLAESEKVIEDMGDDNIPENNDPSSLEEKEREYWQLGQRQISAKSSLSGEIRSMFEKLEVLDSKGNPVLDNYGFNLKTFVDSSTAVNNILDWCKDCTTIEEMEDILREKAKSYPYLNTILDKIRNEPIRSMFFQNFRKDFTTYSIVTEEIDKNTGRRTYKVQIINTKGATETLLKNIATTFKVGGMQGLIVTRDTVEGRGRVNTKEVKAIAAERENITKKLNDAFGNKKEFKKALKKEVKNITALLNKLGVPIMSKTVLATIESDVDAKTFQSTNVAKALLNIRYITETLLENKNKTDYNPMLKEQKDGNVWGTYRNLIDIFAKDIENSIEASTYENGKMYYSFVTPSYMGKLITELKDSIGDSDKFKEFMQKNYKDYRWFYDKDAPGRSKWLNTWLEKLQTKEGRSVLEHKVQLHFGKTPYNELSELGYTLALMHEYFGNSKKNLAWYRLPILANKPSAEFVQFFRITSENSSYRDYQVEIKKGLKKVFNQEVLRIKTVLERLALPSNSGVSKINVYDVRLKDLTDSIGAKNTKNLLNRIKKKTLTVEDMVAIMNSTASKGSQSGAEFRFLEMLNREFIDNTELGQLIVDKLNDLDIDESKLDELLVGEDGGYTKNGAFDSYMEAIVDGEMAQWESIGLFEQVEEEVIDKNKKTKRIKKSKYLSQLGETEDEIRGKLTEYIWNDMFATINLIQLTVTDLAYYKNMEDFQKRYAQVHAPTMKLNASARYKGKRVSDGFFRTIYLKDNEIISEIIPNVKVIFDKKIASIREEDPRKRAKIKEDLIVMRDFILSAFERINVTDAQAYSCPSSYRKKMIAAGTWDDTMELAYKRIASGNYNINDLDVVWQPLKPFVYTQIKKSTGVQTMSEIKTPIQNKNSEYMLLIADALMRGEGRKSTLGAIFDFMENSHYEGREVDKDGNVIKEGTYRPNGIDTVQFESAVKSGLMGVIDINNMEYDDIISTLENAVYYNKDRSSTSDNDMDIYNDQFVHTIPFEDYGIQQNVPAHLEGTQAMGSQIRILSISDISSNATFKVNGENKVWDRDHLVKTYQELIAANIKESFEKLQKDLNIIDKKTDKPITDRAARNRALSDLLIKAIQKDQRYGADLMRACSLDENDEFIIPLNDPIQSLRIQQLLNSIIKSRINKQEVQGGPVVQATVFGVSDTLNIVFKDKNGDVLRTKGKNESDEAYLKYLSDNQASLSHMEVYMPVPSKALERALTKADGTLMSVQEALDNKVIDKEMLKAICYRIPTEDKYSMIPCEIKGFLPKGAGEAIMMPKEITLLTGSDFDIDKMYVMVKEFQYKKINVQKFTENVLKSYKKSKTKVEYNRDKEVIETWIKELDRDGKITTKYSGNQYKVLKRQIEKIWNQRTLDAEDRTFIEKTVGNLGKETTSTRNNKIFDIQWAVLTHEDTMNKMFNPGSFAVQKKTARIIKAIKAGSNLSYSELSQMSLKELDKLSESLTGNIIFSTTQVAFHKQNMTAGKLIGIFANNNTSHAFLSMQNIHLVLDKKEAFSIAGRRVSDTENNLLDVVEVDGRLVSKNIAGFLAASVDAVKDPVLNFMNLNTFTAGPAMLLTRLGFDSDSVGLLLSQPIIEKVTREYFRQNNDSYVSIEDVILQELNSEKHEGWRGLESNIAKMDFSKEDLAKELSNGGSLQYQTEVLLLFKRLAGISKHLNTLTFLTKFNSVTNATGPSIADTLVMRERYNKFISDMKNNRLPFSPNARMVIDKENSPILNAFFEYTVSDKGAARAIFAPYFPHYSATFSDILSIVRETTKVDLDSKTINSLLNDYILYKLTSGKNPIISGDKETRERFIKNFPKEFFKRAEGLVDNDLIKIIELEASSNKCPVPTLKAKTGGFSAEMQEKVKTAWSTLMENPETFDLGRDLFLYNLYRSGFTFSPKTFLHLSSVDTKLALADYIDAIADPEFGDRDVNISDFLLMYRRNHSGNRRIVPELDLPTTDRNKMIKGNTVCGKSVITITFNKSNKDSLNSIIATKNPLTTVFAPVITYKNKLYYTDDYNMSNSGDSITYTEISTLGNSNNFLEYDANDSARTMESVLVSKKSDNKKDTKDTHQDTEDNGNNGATEVNHDKADNTITDEETEYLYSKISKEEQVDVISTYKKEGEDAGLNRLMEYVDKFIKTTKNEKAKKKAKSIMDKFCK